MKINIQITRAELVKKLFPDMSEADVTIDIVENMMPDYIKAAIDATEAIGVTSYNKIACIRAFRDKLQGWGYRVGLADAKGIIEQWQDFKAFAAKYGRIPENTLSNLIRNQI